MFKVFCPGHGCEVLLSIGCIEALRNTLDGPVVDWRCWCGSRGRLHRGSTDAQGHDARVIELAAFRSGQSPTPGTPPERRVG